MPQPFAEYGDSGVGSSSQDPVVLEPRNGNGDIFSKTKMCKFNLIGVCIKGSDCLFAHAPDELQPVPDLFRTKICKTLINTGGCQNPDCRYAHNKEELRAASVVAKPKPGRRPPPPPVAKGPRPLQSLRATRAPLAQFEDGCGQYGLPVLPTEGFAPLQPVGQVVVPVPVAMPVGLVATAWPEGTATWKPTKATAVGTRRGRRGKGQPRSDMPLPAGSRQLLSGLKHDTHDTRSQEDSPRLCDKMPDSFSTQTTAASSCCSGPSKAPGLSCGEESSRGSTSDPDFPTREVPRLQPQPGLHNAVEVMQEGFDTDEELLFGSHDMQYHPDGAHGGVMVKNTFLEFETDAPPAPVLKKVHTAAGRLQELGAEETRHQR